MFSKKTNTILLGVVLATISALSAACVRPPEQPKVEQTTKPEELLPPAPPSVPANAEQTPRLPPPTEAEVRAAIARVYKDVVIERGPFVVGDFNGDGSQDVAVVVAPVMSMLKEINSEVANWILEDPQKIVLPDPTKASQRLAPVPTPTRVAATDLLLAILHGYGPSGWRNSNSRQTYLLKNAAGDNIKSQQMTTILKARNGKAALSKLHGDVISETLGTGPGFLYYNGSKYVWYPKSQGAEAVASK